MRTLLLLSTFVLLAGALNAGVAMGNLTGAGSATGSAFVVIFHDFGSLYDSTLYYTEASPPYYSWVIDSSALIDGYDYNAMGIIFDLLPVSGDLSGQYPGNPFQLSGGVATDIDIPLDTIGDMHGHITYSGLVDSVMIGIYDYFPFLLGSPPALESTHQIDDFDYLIEDIPAGPKAVIAWVDLNGNAAFDSSASYIEPFGWYAGEMNDIFGVGGGCTTAVNITITPAGNVPDRTPLPEECRVRCLPNPFKKAATILIFGDGGEASIGIYDLAGREIASLLENTPFKGPAALRFVPPERMASGNYLLRMTSGGKTITKEIIYLK